MYNYQNELALAKHLRIVLIGLYVKKKQVATKITLVQIVNLFVGNVSCDLNKNRVTYYDQISLDLPGAKKQMP